MYALLCELSPLPYNIFTEAVIFWILQTKIPFPMKEPTNCESTISNYDEKIFQNVLVNVSNFEIFSKKVLPWRTLGKVHDLPCIYLKFNAWSHLAGALAVKETFILWWLFLSF